jgi:Transposase and inactivated derivatives
MGVRRYELTDEEWERIRVHIPTSKTGRPPKDHRLMLNAMMWLAKSGAMWEDLPERYGPWKTVYSRFCKWRDEGVLAEIFTALSMDADYENLSIDSSSIKVHQHASSGKRGLILKSE